MSYQRLESTDYTKLGTQYRVIASCLSYRSRDSSLRFYSTDAKWLMASGSDKGKKGLIYLRRRYIGRGIWYITTIVLARFIEFGGRSSLFPCKGFA